MTRPADRADGRDHAAALLDLFRAELAPRLHALVSRLGDVRCGEPTVEVYGRPDSHVRELVIRVRLTPRICD